MLVLTFTSVAEVASTPLDPRIRPSMIDLPRENGPPRHTVSVPLQGGQNPDSSKVVLYTETETSRRPVRNKRRRCRRERERERGRGR